MTDAIDSTTQASRRAWGALIVIAGVGLSGSFACATPFAAMAALAGLKLSWRGALIAMASVWVGNQAIGYGALGYPLTANSVFWGLAIAGSSLLAIVPARALASTQRVPLAISLPFVAAFTTFELGLYLAGFWLGSAQTAFSVAIIFHIFLINAAAMLGLLAIFNLGAVLAHYAAPHNTTALPRP